MNLLRLLIVLVSLSWASPSAAQGVVTPRGSSSGGGSVTPSVTPTTCSGGAFLYGLSSLIECGANAVNSGSTVTIGKGISGTSKALILTRATSSGRILELQTTDGTAVSYFDNDGMLSVGGAGSAIGAGEGVSITYAPGTGFATIRANSGATEHLNLVAGGNGLRIYNGAITSYSQVESDNDWLLFKHIGGRGAAPTLSSCGTDPSVVTGNDIHGTFTTGSGGTVQACTLTFNAAYTAAPSCFVATETSILLIRPTTTTTTLVVDSAVAGTLASQVIKYGCLGN